MVLLSPGASDGNLCYITFEEHKNLRTFDLYDHPELLRIFPATAAATAKVSKCCHICLISYVTPGLKEAFVTSCCRL